MQINTRFNGLNVVPIHKNEKGKLSISKGPVFNYLKENAPETLKKGKYGDYFGWETFKTIQYPKRYLQTWQGNVAVITGKQHNSSNALVIIDIDDYENAKHYLELFPETYTESTPSGGFHLFYLISFGSDFDVFAPKLLYKGKQVDIEVRGDQDHITLIHPSTYKHKETGEILPKKIHKDIAFKQFNKPKDFVKMLNGLGFSQANTKKNTKSKTVTKQAGKRTFKLSSEPIEAIVDTIVDSGAWKDGQRQYVALALCGFLTKHKVAKSSIQAVITGICDKKGDEDVEERLTAVETTLSGKMEDVTGKTALIEYLSIDGLKCASDLLWNLEAAVVFDRKNVNPPKLDDCFCETLELASRDPEKIYEIFDALIEAEYFFSNLTPLTHKNIATSIKEHKILLRDLKYFSPMFFDGTRFNELKPEEIPHHLSKHFKYHWSNLDLRCLENYSTKYTDFNVDKIALANGVLNRRTMTFAQEELPVAYFALPYEYSTNPKSGTFVEETVKDILGATEEETPEYVTYLEFLGYIFSYGFNMERFMLLFGAASGGKSVLLELIGYLIKEYKSALTLSELGGSNFNPENLIGKLVNTMQDIPKGDFKGNNLEMLQRLVSKETMTINRKYKSGVELGKDLPVMVGAANTLPFILSGDKKPVWRRMLLVRTHNVYAETDENGEQPEGTLPINTGLRDSLESDEDGLNWLFSESVNRFKALIDKSKDTGHLNFSYIPKTTDIGEIHEKYSKPAQWIIEQVAEYDTTSEESLDYIIDKAYKFYQENSTDIYQDLDHTDFVNAIKKNRQLNVTNEVVYRSGSVRAEFVKGLKIKDNTEIQEQYKELYFLSETEVLLKLYKRNKRVLRDILFFKDHDIQVEDHEDSIKSDYPDFPIDEILRLKGGD